MVVGDSVKIDLEGIFTEGAEAHEGLEVVAQAAVKAALVIDLAADQQTCALKRRRS